MIWGPAPTDLGSTYPYGQIGAKMMIARNFL